MERCDLRLAQDIRNILNNGTIDVNPRPKYPDGTPAHTKFVNHVVREYNLEKEFPITTLRPIAWKSAIKEILWIYQQKSNDLSMLNERYNVHYWNSWESEIMPGTIGMRYGGTVNKYDLTNKLIDGIKNDPYGRRHIIDLYQESDFKETDGLYPCAFCSIWNVRGEYLDMMLIQRSGDMLAASGCGGINECQYAAFQMMIAKATGYKPGKFTHVVANEHIYDRHEEAARELLRRADSYHYEFNETFRYKFDNKVKMLFNPKSDNFYDFTIDDFKLIGYEPMKPQIKLELGV